MGEEDQKRYIKIMRIGIIFLVMLGKIWYDDISLTFPIGFIE
jgi:hypothetical protein